MSSGLRSAYKPFNQAVFDECDGISRSLVIDWLKRVHHLDAIGNPNMFGVDLVVFDNFMPVKYVEVEMRLWRDGWHYCPYSTIHVPLRKEKLFNNDLPTFMCVVNQYRKWAYWIDTDKILKAPIIEVKNKAVAKDEYFYDVPVGQWRLFELDEPF
jgi:hypothetical protein